MLIAKPTLTMNPEKSLIKALKEVYGKCIITDIILLLK